MAATSRFGQLSLTAIFLVFFSFFNIATASYLPNDKVDEALIPRNLKPINEARYIAYLKKYFPQTDRYILYTGGSENQVKKFIEANPGYNYYGTLFNAHSSTHPWYKEFNEEVDEDDAEASSIALAKTLSGNVLVFGGIEYKTKGNNSFFTTKEVPELHKGLKDGRIKSINHMIKGATQASQILAKEDKDGKFTWQPGHAEGETNAGDACAMKRAVGGCYDAPKPNKKIPKPKPKTTIKV